MGLGLVTGFIGLLQLVVTVHSISISHTLQFTTARTLVCSPFTNLLVPASNVDFILLWDSEISRCLSQSNS
jgi:hypothetical protein